MKKYYNIHDLIKVQLESKKNTSFSHIVDLHLNYFEKEYINPEEIDIFFADRLPLNTSTIDNVNKYDDENYEFNGQVLKLKDVDIMIKTGEGFKTTIATETRLPPHIFLQRNLILKKATFIHAAGISKKGRAVIFPAFGGTGKTFLTTYLSKQKDVKFLGDDFLILSEDGFVLSCPFPFSVYHYHKKMFPDVMTVSNKLLSSKSALRVTKKIKKSLLPLIMASPKLENLLRNFSPGYVPIPVQQVMQKDKIDNRALLSRVFMLERCEVKDIQVTQVTKDVVITKMISILHHELLNSSNMRINKCFWAMVLFNFMDLGEYFSSLGKILNNCIATSECSIIKIPNNMDLEDMAKYVSNLLE